MFCYVFLRTRRCKPVNEWVQKCFFAAKLRLSLKKNFKNAFIFSRINVTLRLILLETLFFGNAVCDSAHSSGHADS